MRKLFGVLLNHTHVNWTNKLLQITNYLNNINTLNVQKNINQVSLHLLSIIYQDISIVYLGGDWRLKRENIKLHKPTIYHCNLYRTRSPSFTVYTKMNEHIMNIILHNNRAYRNSTNTINNRIIVYNNKRRRREQHTQPPLGVFNTISCISE